MHGAKVAFDVFEALTAIVLLPDFKKSLLSLLGIGRNYAVRVSASEFRTSQLQRYETMLR